MLVRPLFKIDNFQKLSNEVMNVINLAGTEHNQIMCQSLETSPNSWKIGVGSIDSLEEKDEKKYNQINESLKGTYIEELITQLKAFRTRILFLPPKVCYSIHRDYTKRIHIPIITNDQCWMIWPNNSNCYQLEAGIAYLTDTTKPHTYINAGSENRIHIVMCVD